MSITWITPVEVTPGTVSAWTDVDASPYTPSGITGVICEFRNIVDSNYAVGLRKNGSTDNRTGSLYSGFLTGGFSGVDASRIFEAYVGSTTSVDLYIVGYFTDESVFFTNGITKTIPGTSTGWVDVNIGSDTGADTAIGAILEESNITAQRFGIRKNGSSDDRYNIVYYRCWGIVGVDASEIYEHFDYSTAYDYWLIGYIKSGATFNTNGTNESLAGIGAWTDLPSALPASSIGGFFEIISTALANFGLRKNGSSRNVVGYPIFHAWYTSECDANQICEGWIDNVVVDFFLVGYVTAAVEEHSGAASIVGNGSIAGVIQKNGKGSVLKSAGGTLVALGVAAMLGIASIFGGGSQIAIGQKASLADVAVPGSGSITAETNKNAQQISVASGNGAVSSEERKNAQEFLAISVNGEVIANIQKGGISESFISNNGNLIVSANKSPSSSASIPANGAVLTEANKNSQQLSAVSGNGAVSSDGRKNSSESLIISTIGEVIANIQKGGISESFISNNGNLTASANKSSFFPASISANGSIETVALKTGQAISFISGNGILEGIGGKQVSGDSIVSGNGSLVAIGTTTEAYSGIASISANGALEAVGLKTEFGVGVNVFSYETMTEKTFPAPDGIYPFKPEMLE